MRITICDVCDEKYDPDAAMLQMLIPSEFLNTNGDSLAVDICGWPCVSQMVDNFLKQMEPEGEEAQPEEPQAFIAVPKTPTIDTNMDEKTLARFTEQVTGVKRR